MEDNIKLQAFVNKHFFNLFLLTLTFGILLYDAIGFDYTDEICALLLFVLFGVYMFRTKDWQINKAFLTTLAIFVFYLIYSLYIRSNTKAAILTDLVIQIKPYLAFFCVFSMVPFFDANRKEILRVVALFYWGLLVLVGIGEVVAPGTMGAIMGHYSYYAAAVIITSFCFLFCSKFTWLDRITFLVLLSIGILSGRSKFYGFYALAVFVIFFFSDTKHFKLNMRNIVLMAVMLAAIIFVAREKVYFYFYQAVTEEVDKDMIARYVLYANAPSVLMDYFPFGSGFATYGTYASGLYYSDLYEQYGIDGVWGMTKTYYSFIADTYYPSLAQFGVVGIILYITFWIFIFRKAFIYYRTTKNLQYITMITLIIGFFVIEGTTDSTFTTHRGFFVLMLLGLLLGSMKREYSEVKQNENIKVLKDESTTDQ